MNASNKSDKFELEHQWNFFYQNNSKGLRISQDELPQLMVNFNTVEGFWRFFNQILTIDEVPMQNSYMIFKEGKNHIWDSKNPNLQKIAFLIPASKRAEYRISWLNVCLAIISCKISHENKILGVCARPGSQGLKIEFHVQTICQTTTSEIVDSIFERAQFKCLNI